MPHRQFIRLEDSYRSGNYRVRKLLEIERTSPYDEVPLVGQDMIRQEKEPDLDHSIRKDVPLQRHPTPKNAPPHPFLVNIPLLDLVVPQEALLPVHDRLSIQDHLLLLEDAPLPE